ncbi:Beta-lactam-inducible penicillin-binding protein [Clostridium liquoris]|jgi:penicillin-binding protein|uniref:Beta-lactam-inducible penicillin-binding protein n=1 Tax=Clostridium liquoris TaxID=1289519 RepID=A0A2T0B1R8_9CLOT|nr:penicillin-binding transpeptidase domain-containing protein [Clostridium liquoris]PRR77782.1 Beta-lactam-inducible penicillin-binding protein [Clostridium liquoris]
MRKTNSKRLFIALVAVIILILSTFVLGGCSFKQKNSVETFNTYKDYWQKKDYKGMYSMLSNEAKAKISEKNFIDRYSNIYSGIEANNISINAESTDKNAEKIPFSLTMTTAAGEVAVKGYEADMVKEKVDNKKIWAINWSEKMIFPQMESQDKVRVETIAAKRGEIYDRNGYGLAINGTVVTIGIKPADFNANKEANTTNLAKILDIKPSAIEDKLKADSNPEHFLPIVNISVDKKDIIAEAMKIPGVIYQKPNNRIYQGGEAMGSLIGYVGPITAEELKKLHGQGYSSTSSIGKRGLEQVYENKLRAKDGKFIYISKQKDGVETEKIQIAKTEPKNGENITLSIDAELQKNIYENMNGEKGASTAINPKTGEILAMVSSPSFDPNLFTTYAPESIKTQWEKDKNIQFDNRFKAAYAPGSAFKLFTAIAGLEKGSINPSEAINIQGNQWQPSGSWGAYKVTRVVDPGKPIDLKNAFIYSDNIYFAQQALKIGKETFIAKAKDFGIGETLPIDYPIAKSQISADNSIKNDIQLADSGYGQGQVLMSPLHVALMYSAVLNKGDIMTPTLQLQKDKAAAKVWKKGVVSEKNANILLEDLTEVIENPSGTGHGVKIPGVALAGKTGTAELKKSVEDTSGEEYGWLVSMNTDNPKMVLVTMIEDVRSKGGSHYVIPMQKKVLEYYFIQRGGH